MPHLRLIILLISFVLAACATGEPGSGKANEEMRELPPFQSIEIGGALNSKVAIADTQRVELRGDDNLLPLVVTEVVDGRLVVRTTRAIRPKVDMLLTVSVPKLHALSISGAGTANVAGLSNEAFKVQLSGAGNLSASGTTRRLDLDVSGAGKVDARDLKAETVRVSVSGAGDIDVHASSSLDVTISGVGDVTYSGEPPDLKQHISGAGSLKKR